jgi:hypothetical protein
MPVFSENGWSGLEAARPDKTDVDERRDLDRDILGAFTTPRGRRVLQWLRDVTIEASGPHPTLTGIGLEFRDQLVYREGQRDLVRDIEKRMERAKEER